MNFHLAHIVPSKTLHGLNGYKEVIDTVQWGLEQLGHTVAYGLNSFSRTATNIIFGAQVLPLEILEQLPSETIVYNFEQGRGLNAETVKPQLRLAAQRFRIWDYSAGNGTVWSQLGAARVRIVPIGYAPILQRIERQSLQDIDVLMYGVTGNDRLGAFHALAMSGLTVVYVCGLYGESRDRLIGRSKLIANINVYEHSKIFEIVRVSYLLANRKAVVADVASDTLVDDELRTAIKSTTRERLVTDCLELVANDAARTALENAGFEVIRKRDIRTILERALEDDD